MDQLLATYREAQLTLQRTFKLYEDRVTIKSRGRAKAELTIRFDGLRPEPNKVWIHQDGFQIALGLLLGSFAILAIVGFMYDYTPSITSFGFFFLIGKILGLLGIFLCCFTFRRIEFSQFLSESGKEVFFDIGRVGPDQKYFPEFVNLLKAQIRQIYESKKQKPDV